MFGYYKPQILIATTPNAEFNVYFPDLKYGTPESKFRHDDHKFEWTRNEFKEWCEMVCETYGYEYTIEGIGKIIKKEVLDAYTGPEDVGHCSQLCLFKRKNNHQQQPKNTSSPPNLEDFCQPSEDHEKPTLMGSFSYPYFNEPPMGPEDLFKLVLRFAGYICDYDTGLVMLERLWNVSDIKHQFKRRKAFEAWMDRDENYCGRDGFESVIDREDGNKAYKIKNYVKRSAFD
ncbi:hypothetical protein H4219_006248 [Mycoemilia scoparia]|uniref:Small RNA 2'-O-methyltransferase n=1 Tax=Mycoemilia scoparia TaxID=417184 RepID=A0A9W7ZS76_9FUNG|nr:hypothetical protein H4219_006248 [Mycoemilia scoparia]